MSYIIEDSFVYLSEMKFRNKMYLFLIIKVQGLLFNLAHERGKKISHNSMPQIPIVSILGISRFLSYNRLFHLAAS